MENNIASILFARGIMPDDFISYSTYAAVGEIVKEMERLREERKELVEGVRKYVHHMNRFFGEPKVGQPPSLSDLQSLLSKFPEVPNE